MRMRVGGRAAAVVIIAACHRSPRPMSEPTMPSPPTSIDAVRAAEEAVFDAIRRRDRAALARLTTDDFVLVVPGSPRTDRAAFLDLVAAIPGEILTVTGEDVDVRLLHPDAALVTGQQVSTVRLDGKVVVDRGAFADVFERRQGRWVISYAFNV